MDRSLVEKLPTHLVDSVELVRRHGKPELLESDPVPFGFVTHTQQTAVQSAIDVPAGIVSERGLGEPDTNRELFVKLAGDGWVSPERANLWKRIVSFRNVVVHRYLTVDPEIVRAIVESNLNDLLAFAHDVRQRLGDLPR